eukprot:TRINITY_DN80563_c0_g1_i1.p1 TRINITY_DN80563_c0_g1~~TRINITY_DN80563_c0_g1_i1.p1  ORF type:complete len:268 (-),score=29.02 TRINITY_DN80563_c0_g1_i1:252-1055(-)
MPTCDQLRKSLRKVGRKVSGTKAELENRLEQVSNENDKGWLRQVTGQIGSYKYLASGAHRHVYKGIYKKGPRKGQYGVKKKFKTGRVFEKKFFEKDIQAVDAAGEVIEAFNGRRISNYRVYLNRPEVWKEVEPDRHGRRSKSLVEPFIEGSYRKFNSNTGYADDGYVTMQALSHFSYHYTNGKQLLCDLQGGKQDGCYVLTDPVICSEDEQFGVTDLGRAGIQNFFFYHRCNKLCRSSWRKPPAIHHFQAMAGTSFGPTTVFRGVTR